MQTVDGDGNTPLHRAVLDNDLANATLILSLSPTATNSQNNQGLTPLHLACTYTNNAQNNATRLKILQLFVECPQTDVNIQENGEKTALCVAVVFAFVEAVNMLLEANAEIDIASKLEENTAIHLVFYKIRQIESNTRLIELHGGQNELETKLKTIAFALILRGADLKRPNVGGHTPLEICPKKFRDEMRSFAALRVSPVGIPKPPKRTKNRCVCGNEMIESSTPPPLPSKCNICNSQITQNTPHLICTNVLRNGKNCHPNGKNYLCVCMKCVREVGVGGAAGVRCRVKPEITEPKRSWGKATGEMIGEVVSVDDNTDRVQVKFASISSCWISSTSELEVVELQPGMRVQIKQSVSEPKFGWHGHKKTDIGEIESVGQDELLVRFRGQASAWKCRPIEVGIHEGTGTIVVGDSVKIRDLGPRGPRRGFDKADPAGVGVLERIDEDGEVWVRFSASVWRGFVGEIETVSNHPGSSMVKVTVSSGHEQALLDGQSSTFWESQGAAGTHWVMFQLPQPVTQVASLEFELTKALGVDFLPETVEVWLGSDARNLKHLCTTEIKTYGWTALCPHDAELPNKLEFKFIQVRITKCHNNGMNCRIAQFRMWANPGAWHVPSTANTMWKREKYAKKGLLDELLALLVGATDSATPARKQVTADMVIHGQFQLIKKLGSGGFGETWLAQNKSAFDAKVVVKLLHSESGRNLQMFESEGKKLMLLKHAQIPQLQAFFFDPQLNCHVLVMDHVVGKNLTDVVQESPNKKLSSDRTKAILLELFEILKFVHSHNIVHRDVKAENVMLREDNHVVLIDFGAGTMLQSAHMPNQTNETAHVLTQGYAAPEVLLQNGCAESDYFSVGALGLFLVTGVHPALLFRQHGGIQAAISHVQHTKAADDSLARILLLLLEENVTRRKSNIQLIQMEVTSEFYGGQSEVNERTEATSGNQIAAQPAQPQLTLRAWLDNIGLGHVHGKLATCGIVALEPLFFSLRSNNLTKTLTSIGVVGRDQEKLVQELHALRARRLS